MIAPAVDWDASVDASMDGAVELSGADEAFVPALPPAVPEHAANASTVAPPTSAAGNVCLRSERRGEPAPRRSVVAAWAPLATRTGNPS
jgi:hypothetical protein